MNKRPLIIFDDSFKRGKAGQAGIKRQNLLLKGMMIHGNMDKATHFAGIRSAVELYRTFDRIQLRRGYHEALADEDVDLRWIVNRIKKHADSPNGQVALSGLRMLLGSLGLNRYDVAEEGHKNWEDTLLQLSESYDSKEQPLTAYKVNPPQVPEASKLMRQKENKIGKELYEHQPESDGETQGS